MGSITENTRVCIDFFVPETGSPSLDIERLPSGTVTVRIRFGVYQPYSTIFFTNDEQVKEFAEKFTDALVKYESSQKEEVGV